MAVDCAGIAGLGARLIKTSLRAAGLATRMAFTPDLLPIFARADIYLGGAFALEQGQILSAMLLAAMTVFIIERQFAWAGVCMLVAAGFSWVGLMHSYRWMPSDTVLQPGWGSGATWATGYLLLALLFYWASWKRNRSGWEPLAMGKPQGLRGLAPLGPSGLRPERLFEQCVSPSPEATRR
jgi:AGZA family xanthine/uracil permease-like MFS transporter